MELCPASAGDADGGSLMVGIRPWQVLLAFCVLAVGAGVGGLIAMIVVMTSRRR
jgi:hypothetical protein